MIIRRIKMQFKLMMLTVFITSQFILAQTEQSSITLAVDATDAPKKILHAQESIPVKAGPLTLLYPKWIPGEHGPTGPVVDLAGLKITGGAKPVTWRRDLEDMYALHLEVPAGVDRLELSFDFILPPQKEGFSSASSSSAQLVIISWNQVVLSPKDKKPDYITIIPSLTLPEGWKFGTALQTKQRVGNTVQFAPVSLTMLVDSPVLAGTHFRRIDLTSESGIPHFLNLAGDSEEALDMSPDQIAAYRRLVVEANALFGAHHYDHYDFLY